MKRFHLVEFEDLNWFPDFIRNGITDYLRFFINLWDVYKPTVPVIKKVLEEHQITEVVDVCSGGGGYIIRLNKYLNNPVKDKIKILLSDKEPNIPAFEFIKKNNPGIDYVNESVEASNVPAYFKGMRLLFSSFHHFKKDYARSVLEDAVKKNVPIGIFEAGERRWFDLFAVTVSTPILYIIITPFIRPFKLNRIIFTYLIPLIPIFALWDGIVSMLRMYKPEELLGLTLSIASDYYWESGKLKNMLGTNITYLVGYPANTDS